MPRLIEQKQSTALVRMLEALLSMSQSAPSAEFDAATNFYKFILTKLQESNSQIFQDLFVLFILKEKRSGFFIEFGATNGKNLSNTFLLEKSYGWSGILAEPGICWFEDLNKNRGCSLDRRCVWSETGKSLVFNETTYPELSTIDIFSSRPDDLKQARTFGSKYTVDTVSLDDLAKEHNAPFEIDYLSIDTEGSELPILEAHDFQRHRIK
jgi:FkbM family methyltransferase